MTVKNIPINVPFDNLKRIVHLADIHIRLFKRQEEYKECFSTLYRELSKTDLDHTVIVVAGDITHAKLDLSPEAVELISDFFLQLSNLAPTIVIAGNHDMNVANQNRLDSLTPIISNIANPNLHYLKYSGIYPLADIDFYVWSIIGQTSDWPLPVNDTKTKICLFHGPIHNATTDVGYTVTNRHVMIESFDGFDMVILGDIHKHQVLQQYDKPNNKPIMVYASSLIQQNHGEALRGHGWCDWNVSTKSFTFRELYNSYGFYTLRIENGVIPDYRDMPENVHLRIFAGVMDDSDIKKLVAKIRTERTIKELSVSRFDGIKKNSSVINLGATQDITDINVQNQYITEYLKSARPELSLETLDRVIEINKQSNSEISIDDIARKIVWIPKSLKYDNLFTYGENNYINFSSLKDVIGIFAPNASGKTSIAEAICFALYDRTPRTIRAANIMNTRKFSCSCEFMFEIDGIEYVIERKGTKNKKGEVKIDVDFYRIEKGLKISLNGEERRYTNANIRSYVGDYEDFILTTFSSSSSQGLFVDRGQSDRKDLLSQFMGLTIFDKLHKVANDEIKEVSSVLRRFKNDDFTQELVDVQSELVDLQNQKELVQSELDSITGLLRQLDELIQRQYELKIPVSISLNKEELDNAQTRYLEQLDYLTKQYDLLVENEVVIRNKLSHAEMKIQNDYATVETEFTQYNSLISSKEILNFQYQTLQNQKINAENALLDLNKHEYDPNCDYCIKNGHATILAKTDAESSIVDYEKKLQYILDKLQHLESELNVKASVVEKHNKFLTGKKWIDSAKGELVKITTNLNTTSSNINKINNQLTSIDRDIQEYHKSIDAINANKLIDIEIAKLNQEKTKCNITANGLNREVTRLSSRIAVLTQRKSDMLSRIHEASELEDKFEAYEAYLNAVSRDGLPYKLISEILPSLEINVNNLLSQMVSFTVVFDTDGKNVNMKICYDDDRVWPLELASGMEKFITSLAIRVALTNVSSLPKSNFLIIDEGLGTLDPDNLSSIFMMFDVLRTQFEFILLISHVDAVRDIADSHIEIERSNNFSRIYHV